MLSCKICEIFKNFWCDEAIASLIKFKFNFALFTSIKFHKLVENYVISFLGLGPATREITGKFIETVKWKNCKVHVKKTATLLNIYYFTCIFQGISLGFKQFDAAVYKDRRVPEAAVRECSSE